MSDGGNEIAKQDEKYKKKLVVRDLISKSRGNEDDDDDYGRAIAKIAVAQICKGLGFESFQISALENLADVAIRYAGDLGKVSHFHANLAGRTHCNVFDIVQGLDDLGSGSPTSSTRVSELIHYVSSAKEIEFAQPVANFPVIRPHRSTPSFLQINETPDVKHIPPWLPAFPDPHTYVHTPMWNERKTDPRMDKIEQARQRRKAERSLLRLQQRLACNGSVEHALVELEDYNVQDDGGKVKQAGYIAAPVLLSEEEDGSPVVNPSKVLKEDQQSAVLETFAPAIEAAKNDVRDSDDCERRDFPKKRPVLQFKFRTGKKSLGVPLDLTLQNNILGKSVPWFGRDDDKDDKKRRAEQILKESMENQQDVAQL